MVYKDQVKRPGDEVVLTPQSADRFAAVAKRPEAANPEWTTADRDVGPTARRSGPDTDQGLAMLTVSVQEYDIADGAMFAEGAE